MIVLFVVALHSAGAAALLHPLARASPARVFAAVPSSYGSARGPSPLRVLFGGPPQLFHGEAALPHGHGCARDKGRAAEPLGQGVALAAPVAPSAARRARGLLGCSFHATWLVHIC